MEVIYSESLLTVLSIPAFKLNSASLAPIISGEEKSESDFILGSTLGDGHNLTACSNVTFSAPVSDSP